MNKKTVQIPSIAFDVVSQAMRNLEDALKTVSKDTSRLESIERIMRDFDRRLWDLNAIRREADKLREELGKANGQIEQLKLQIPGKCPHCRKPLQK